MRAIRRGAAASALPFLVLSVIQFYLAIVKSGSGFPWGLLALLVGIWIAAGIFAYRYPRVIRLHLGPDWVGRTDFLGRLRVADRRSLVQIDEIRVRLSSAPTKTLWVLVESAGRSVMGINPAIWDPTQLRSFVNDLAIPFRPSDGTIFSAQELQQEYPGLMPAGPRHPGAVTTGIGLGLVVVLAAIFVLTHR